MIIDFDKKNSENTHIYSNLGGFNFCKKAKW